MNKSGNCYGAWSIEHYFGESEFGGWRNDMTADMVEQLDCVTEQKLQGSGLKFQVCLLATLTVCSFTS